MKKDIETEVERHDVASRERHTNIIIREDIDDLTGEDIKKLKRLLRNEKKSIAVSTMNKWVHHGKAKYVPYAGKPDAFREVEHKTYRLSSRNSEAERWYPLPDNFFKYK